MAPSRPLPRSNTTPGKSILKTKTARQSTDEGPLFTTTKKDKRRIKHAQLMSKVTKSTTAKPRRRRPNKKLVTTLDALADALPADEGSDTGPSQSTGVAAESQVNIIKRKSMKSRPGAMKRKQKLDNTEKERFARNMAQMAVAPAARGLEGEGEAAPSRFQALRGFIAQTLERRADVPGPVG